MLRAILGVVGGVIVAMLTIFLLEMLGHFVWPMAAEVDMADGEAVGRALAAAPIGAKLYIVFGWFFGAFVGAFVAGLISRAYWPGWIVAGLIALAGIANIILIPHPVWMQIAAVAAPLLGGFAAHHVGPARRRAESAA